MKNIVESPEVFEAYARIDFCYLMIGEANKKFQVPRSPIEIMVDKATGYDEHRNSETLTTIIKYLRYIIKDKKFIEADYSHDEKFLNALIEFRKKRKTELKSNLPLNK